ncbi:MAG: hypothetical protein H7Y86_04900 [Rhizobacter sp.]|nr:hypothetical protein [Ferruginibacter sp.]
MKSLLFFCILLTTGTNSIAQLNVDSLDAANAKAISNYPEFIHKAAITGQDSSIWLTSDIRKDHRFYGYEKSNTNSNRRILFSIFTNDVEGNPYKLRYGAYYQTAGLDGKKLKYTGITGKFIKAQLWDNSGKILISELFFERKWFVFD